MKRAILFLVLGIFLVGVVLASCSGGADLDISQIDRTPNSSFFKVVATANQNGECLEIAWTTEELNDWLSEESPEEIIDNGIYGDIELIEQIDTFHTVLDKDEKLYYYTISGSLGLHWGACSETCQEEYPTTDFYVYDTIGNCYCIYQDEDSEIATFGTFNGVGDRNGKAAVSFTGLEPLEIDYGESDGSNSSDKLSVSWRGDLLAGHSIDKPNYNVYKDEGGNFHLTSLNYNDIKETQFEANDNHGTIEECLDEVNGWLSGGVSGAENCINAYNEKVNQLLQDKISTYLSSANKSIVENAYFEGSSFVVEEKPYSASYPQFTLTFDAEWVGVHYITGEPEITSYPSSISFTSGESEKLEFKIKNIADENGAFTLNLDCDGARTTLSGNKLLLKPDESEIVTAEITTSTDETKNIECNFEVYATKDNSKYDGIIFNVEVKPIEKKTYSSNSDIEKSTTSGITGNVVSVSTGSPTGIIILIIFLVLIGSSIGFFIYVKNKKNKKPNKKTSAKTKCRKCGHTLRPNAKFCTKCGTKQ